MKDQAQQMTGVDETQRLPRIVGSEGNFPISGKDLRQFVFRCMRFANNLLRPAVSVWAR